MPAAGARPASPGGTTTVHFDTRLKRWRFDFWRDGVRHQGYCLELDGETPVRTKKAAADSQERYRAELQTTPKAGAPVPRGAHTLAKAMSVYLGQLSPGRHAENQKAYVAELLAWFKPTQRIMLIGNRLEGAEGYIAWSRRQPIKIYVGGSRKKGEVNAASRWKISDRLRDDATINRYLDCLRRAIGLYGGAIIPATGKPRLPSLPKIPKLKESKRRPRPIPDGDLQKIQAVAAPALRDALELWRQMGFRRTELLQVPIPDVDLEHRGIWLRAEDTKGDQDEFVPANAIAMEVLERRVAEAERIGSAWLFWWIPAGKDAAGEPHRPRPLKSVKTAWRGAQRRAGIKRPYRIHDLKASFVTAIAPHARDPKTIQRLARHADFETTQAYLAVLDPASRRAVEAMGRAQRRPKAVRDSVRETLPETSPFHPQKARSASIKSR